MKICQVRYVFAILKNGANWDIQSDKYIRYLVVANYKVQEINGRKIIPASKGTMLAPTSEGQARARAHTCTDITAIS
jgi:hypothetical protein